MEIGPETKRARGVRIQGISLLDNKEETPGSAQQTNPRLEAALDYAINRKWHVFPLVVGTRAGHKSKDRCDGRPWGKTTDPNEIRADFNKWPDANVGIATGPDSGIFVLDIDTAAGHGPDIDGFATLAELEESNGTLPPTLEAESPSGSVHIIFNYPIGLEIKNSVGVIGKGLDIRGDGGMIVGVPSVKPGKGVYKWRNDLPIADAPQWLIDKATRPEPDSGDNPEQPPFEAPRFEGDGSRKSRKEYGKKVKQSIFDRLSDTAPGRRNDELNKSAFLLGKLAAAGAVKAGPAMNALYLASEINGHVRDKGITQTKNTIRSGFASGLAQPWTFHQEWSGGAQYTRDDQDRPHRAGGNGPWPFEAAKNFTTDYNRRWIIKNVIAPGEVSTWCALPKKGKSMLLGDIAFHITAKADWRGYRTKKTGAVVYFALERADLVKRRFNAQAGLYNVDPTTLAFYAVNQVIDMMDPRCAERFIATIKTIEQECGLPVVMIIIDTTAKAIAAGGGEENSARDKGMMRANARRILVEIADLHIALISHTGKDPERGERGSNAGLGDDDMLVIMNGQTAIIAARNDGAEGLLTNYKITSVVVGEDEDGDKIDIAVIDPDTTAAAVAPKDKPKGQPGMALDFLVEAINEVGAPPPPDLPVARTVTRVVTVDQWEEQCRKRRLSGGRGNNSAFRKAFDRAADKLQELRLIAILDDYAWIVYE